MYEVDTRRLKNIRNMWLGFIIVYCIIIGMFSSILLPELVSSNFDYKFMSIAAYILLVSICLVFGILSMERINKKLRKIEYLSNKGFLIKNLDYQLIEEEKLINGEKEIKILVNYEISRLERLTLLDKVIVGRGYDSNNKLVDVVLDLKDYSNYILAMNVKDKRKK